MSDANKPPLIFAKHMGALRPVNRAAIDMLNALEPGKHVKAKITSMTRNQRRRGFYWVMLTVAAEVLSDRTNDPWDAELLHLELKKVLKLGVTFTTPSGREVFKPASTADGNMGEAERAHWTNRCANVLSHWVGVPIHDLMDEVRSRAASEGVSDA